MRILPAALSLGTLCLIAGAQWGPWKSTDAWSHPAVPLFGVVRSQGVDRPFTMELTAFGLSGASDDF